MQKLVQQLTLSAFNWRPSSGTLGLIIAFVSLIRDVFDWKLTSSMLFTFISDWASPIGYLFGGVLIGFALRPYFYNQDLQAKTSARQGSLEKENTIFRSNPNVFTLLSFIYQQSPKAIELPKRKSQLKSHNLTELIDICFPEDLTQYKQYFTSFLPTAKVVASIIFMRWKEKLDHEKFDQSQFTVTIDDIERTVNEKLENELAVSGRQAS